MSLPPRLAADTYKPKERLRSTAHRDWVRGHRCSVPGCQQMPIEVAHLRLGTGGGMGVKPSDAWCWSACRDHHAEQHQLGERTFASKYGLDLRELASEFFKRSPHRNKLDAPRV